MTEIVTGDTVVLTLSLKEPDGTASNVASASQIRVALIRKDRSALLAGPYTASSVAAGAAWSTGVVVITIPGADTAAITDLEGDLEVEAIIGGTARTWPRVTRGPVQITKGLIT